MTKVLETARITTLAELERFCENVRTALDCEGKAVTGFGGANAAGEGVMLKGAIRLSLMKETLTDGSAVYDIAAQLRDEYGNLRPAYDQQKTFAELNAGRASSGGTTTYVDRKGVKHYGLMARSVAESEGGQITVQR